jgi:hypothetical protein
MTSTRQRDYSKGKIYKLECLITGKVYIGSTTKEYLSQRLTAHKAGFNRWQKGKSNYVSSFDVVEGGNYEITLLELYPCGSCDELHAKEREWIEKITCVNKKIPIRTQEETKESKRTHNKIYHQDNAVTIAERKRGYMKMYQQNKKEHIADYQKSYYEANKDRLKQYNKEWRERRKAAQTA